MAIGSTPATTWLEGSGLRLNDGVVCDAHCRAAADVYAVGDVARWHHRGFARDLRLENRTNATEQGIFVAAAITGADSPYTPVPYFWSDQYGVRMQVHGLVPADARIRVIEGSVAERKFVALAEAGDKVTGAVAWNSPRGVLRARHLIVDAMKPAR